MWLEKINKSQMHHTTDYRGLGLGFGVGVGVGVWGWVWGSLTPMEVRESTSGRRQPRRLFTFLGNFALFEQPNLGQVAQIKKYFIVLQLKCSTIEKKFIDVAP